MPTPRYQWRRLSPQEKRSILKSRQTNKQPWHSPPHSASDVSNLFHITAACYEHKTHIGISIERIQSFEKALLEVLEETSDAIYAWCILPNHYHALIESGDLKNTITSIGLLHGRTSHKWNGEENSRGRKVFHRCADRFIRSESHFWATMNYIHNNPVHHGYVKRWTDWSYSSAHHFLDRMGREEAKRIWKYYPVLEYGKHWDDPEL